MDYLNITVGDQVNFYFNTKDKPVNLTNGFLEFPFKNSLAAIAEAAKIQI